MNTSQVGRDGLVFLKVGVSRVWYINVASIVRLFGIDEEECAKRDLSFPTTGIDIVGRNAPIYIQETTPEELKDDIDKAIKNHYDNIANKELLG